MKHTITLELPAEFIALCEEDGIDPQTVLRGFIADLCEIMQRRFQALAPWLYCLQITPLQPKNRL